MTKNHTLLCYVYYMIEGVIYRYKSPSGKYYIGQTIDENSRRRAFLTYNAQYGGIKIDNARRKYGPENFEYTVLIKITGDNPEEVKNYLNILEEGFIKMYDSFKNGYNSTTGGDSRILSEESRKILSEAHKGQIPWMKGKKQTEESKRKMSESLKGMKAWNKGIPMSEEQKKKLSEVHKGKPSGRKGIKLNDEWRKKLSEAHKGKPSGRKGKNLSEETRQKISESLKGRNAWNKGIPMTDEHKKKLGDSRKGKHRVYSPDGSYHYE